MTEMFDDQAFARKRIADLNDKFRKNLPAGGRVYMTAGVNGEGPEFVSKALAKMIAFDDLSADDDPHREHDFGSFQLGGEKLFWKIDLYERAIVKHRPTRKGTRTSLARATRWRPPVRSSKAGTRYKDRASTRAKPRECFAVDARPTALA